MLTASNIHKSFETVEVLKGIDLRVEAGEIVAITGPSGAGKTTLLQILGSLDRPDSGSVCYDLRNAAVGNTDGKDTSKKEEATNDAAFRETTTNIFSLGDSRLAALRNRHIGFVFQFHQLLPEFTLVENVALPGLIAGRNRKEVMDQAREVASTLGLADRLTHHPAQLSGGERQRAAVARAIINSPEIVFADEPSGSLDSANRDELHRLFLDIRRRLGTTFVIVTHDQSLASMADRIVKMRDGLIIP